MARSLCSGLLRLTQAFRAVALVVLVLSGCRQVDNYYVVGSAEQRQQLRQLLALLEQHDAADEGRFILVQQISYYLLEAGHRERQLNFLTAYVQAHPHDPYAASHLLNVAEGYREMGATAFAVHYYQQILRTTTDLRVQGRSIHYHCLSALLELVEDPEDRILYYKELISRFGDLVNLGETHFYLARMYEAVGEWELAMQAYERFLRSSEAEVPGFPGARKQIQDRLAFYHSKKDWTMRDLGELVNRIRNAIRARRMTELISYRSKASFFTKSWKAPEAYVGANAAEFEISRFLTSQVTIAKELDAASNNSEAYLRLYAPAAVRIPVWYLYFRRVEYEPDPEIHGNWEWAGIYLGERL